MSGKAKPSRHYDNLKELYPDVMKALEGLGSAVRGAGPLDAKTGQLIQLAAAAAVRSEGAVHSHARRALAGGATPEEVYHALVLLISTIGFPRVAAAISWVQDVAGE